MLEPECTACKCPLDRLCKCEDCRGGFHRITDQAQNLRVYCHICLELSRILFRSTYFSKLDITEADRRRRMGL